MSAASDIAAVLAGERRWCVVTADCLPLLAEFGEGSVDCVLTDAPYDEKTHEGSRSQGATESAIDFAPLESLAFVPELLRIARRWALGFCANEQLGDYKRAAGDDRYIRGGTWVRTDGTPQLTGDRPAQGTEGIAIMHRPGRKRWNAGGKRATWTHGVARADRVHPTQKPVPLMVELLEDFTDANELILDPFCGSGTTGVAAMKLGRRFIGLELRADYAEAARARIDAEVRNLPFKAVSTSKSGQIGLFAPPANVVAINGVRCVWCDQPGQLEQCAGVMACERCRETRGSDTTNQPERGEGR